jgi:hypothetical protein
MNTQSYKIHGKEGNTTLVAKLVRDQLKKEFPKCTFSVTSKYFSGGSELTVALMSAPFEAMVSNSHWNDGYAQLNHNQLRKTFTEQSGGEDHTICTMNGWEVLPEGVAISNGAYVTEQAWKVLARAVEIGQGENWDNSDISTDYFDVNYYFDINIGKWNKPFVNTAPKTEPQDFPMSRAHLLDEE